MSTEENAKLVLCGLPNTGANVIAKKLKKLGYKTIGWEPHLSTELLLRWHEGRDTPLLAATSSEYEVFEDFPWPQLGDNALYFNENTKFALTAPSAGSWFDSFQTATSGQENWIGHYLVFGTYDKTDATRHMAVYDAHNAKFRDKINAQPQSFIELDTPGPSDWGKLFRFWRPRPIGISIAPKSGLIYRHLAKCGCSTIGHMLARLETGNNFLGNIHGVDTPLVKPEFDGRWASGLSPSENFFTFVRNPFSRIESCFWDKIMSLQSNGVYYKGDFFHSKLKHYGFNMTGDPQINFSAFLRFVEDDLVNNRSQKIEEHYHPILDQLGATLLSFENATIDFIGHVEHIERDIARLYNLYNLGAPPGVAHENSSRKLALLTYGEEELKIMKKIYELDFEHLGYGTDPGERDPINPVNIPAVQQFSKKAILEALSR